MDKGIYGAYFDAKFHYQHFDTIYYIFHTRKKLQKDMIKIVKFASRARTSSSILSSNCVIAF